MASNHRSSTGGEASSEEPDYEEAVCAVPLEAVRRFRLHAAPQAVKGHAVEGQERPS